MTHLVLSALREALPFIVFAMQLSIRTSELLQAN